MKRFKIGGVPEHFNLPWPCFVVAVRNEIFDKHKDVIKEVLKVVGSTAKEIKVVDYLSKLN